MIIVAVKITTLAGKRDAMLDRARVLVDLTRQEPGNISYGFYSAADDPDGILIFELWASQQALDEHKKTAHFLDFIKEAPTFKKGEEVKLFEVQE